MIIGWVIYTVRLNMQKIQTNNILKHFETLEDHAKFR